MGRESCIANGVAVKLETVKRERFLAINFFFSCQALEICFLTAESPGVAWKCWPPAQNPKNKAYTETKRCVSLRCLTRHGASHREGGQQVRDAPMGTKAGRPPHFVKWVFLNSNGEMIADQTTVPGCSDGHRYRNLRMQNSFPKRPKELEARIPPLITCERGADLVMVRYNSLDDLAVGRPAIVPRISVFTLLLSRSEYQPFRMDLQSFDVGRPTG